MKHLHWLLAVMVLPSVACTRLEMSLGKESKLNSDETVANKSATLTQYKTWNSVEDGLKHLDALRKETADQLMERYHTDGRERVRAGFRQFRAALAKEASREDSFSRWKNLDRTQCLKIEKSDLFDLEDYGDLRTLIETAYVSKMRPDKASAFNPQISPRLDEITKLAFFEFGIAIEGESGFEETDQTLATYSSVRWKVIHEIGEPQYLEAQDAEGVLFAFARTQKPDGHESFSLEAAVGPGVYEDQQYAPVPAMTLQYKRYTGNAGPRMQSLEFKKGLRAPNGSWTDLRMSRRVSLYHMAEEGEIFRLVETINYGLPGEMSRYIKVSVTGQEICAQTKVDGPNDGGGQTPPPPSGGGSGGGQTPPPPPGGGHGNDPGQNEDNPSQQ